VQFETAFESRGTVIRSEEFRGRVSDRQSNDADCSVSPDLVVALGITIVDDVSLAHSMKRRIRLDCFHYYFLLLFIVAVNVNNTCL